MARADPERLFFALWPDEDTRGRLAALRDDVVPSGRARPVATGNLHLTLAFLGNVDGARRARLERAAGRLRLPGFGLRLTRIGHWPRGGILWAAPEATPPPLDDLAGGLARAALDCGLELDRRPFAAHVTLARRAGPADRRPAPVPWAVGGFALVRSEQGVQGVRYRPVAQWPLADSSAGP